MKNGFRPSNTSATLTALFSAFSLKFMAVHGAVKSPNADKNADNIGGNSPQIDKRFPLLKKSENKADDESHDRTCRQTHDRRSPKKTPPDSVCFRISQLRILQQFNLASMLPFNIPTGNIDSTSNVSIDDRFIDYRNNQKGHSCDACPVGGNRMLEVFFPIPPHLKSCANLQHIEDLE